MADYLWECSLFPPRVGVTKEKRGTIFCRDPKKPFKAWWNGCGIHEGTATLKESKEIALRYMLDHAEEMRNEAAKTIVKATQAIDEINSMLESIS